MFADGGDDFHGQPSLESSGYRFAAGEQQRIESALVDNDHFLIAGGGGYIIPPPFRNLRGAPTPDARRRCPAFW